jgi:hypothetical protein
MAYECYPEKYIASYGETWESISMDFYDTPYKIAELISCNREYSDTLIFEENTELNVPILKVNTTSDTLAPWKRGA